MRIVTVLDVRSYRSSLKKQTRTNKTHTSASAIPPEHSSSSSSPSPLSSDPAVTSSAGAGVEGRGGVGAGDEGAVMLGAQQLECVRQFLFQDDLPCMRPLTKSPSGEEKNGSNTEEKNGSNAEDASNQSASLTTIFYNVGAFKRMDPRAILTAASQMPFHETFREMDMDSSRDLRKEEIRDVLHKQGDDVDEVELNTLFSAMDLNHDGSVSFMEANAHQERELQVIMESLNQPYP